MIHKFFISFLIIFSTALYGQFEAYKHVAGPSLGFSFLGSSFQYGASHEYGINLSDLGIETNGRIGIGGFFRYWTYEEETSNVQRNYTDILVGFQTNYHFYMPNDKVDPWFGFIAAYDFGYEDNKIKTPGFIAEEKSYGGFWVGANAGTRYWVNSNLGFSLRLGFGINSYGFLDFGIDYKFN